MGKILDTAKSAEKLDYRRYKIKALLSSKSSGAGKTQGAVTIPGRKLLIDIDRRSETVWGYPGVKILRWEGKDPVSAAHWLWLEQIRKELWSEVSECRRKKMPFPYDAIISDGNSALFKTCMSWALTTNPKTGLGGAPAEHHYVPQMHNASAWINSLIGLPCHVIFTGHEDLIEEEKGGISCYLPKVTGKLRTEISRWFNETYYCTKITKTNKEKGGTETKFIWVTDKAERRNYLKSSMNQLSKYWKDPILIDFDREFTGFEDLLIRRFGDEAKEDILKKREEVKGWGVPV